MPSFHFDGEVNVPGTARIKDRLDGAEIILAGGSSEKTAKALEVLVAGGVGVLAVQIDAVIVHLPDLDQGIANRVPFDIEDATAQVSDFAHGWRERVVDDDQVIVGVEGKVVRVERPFGLARCQESLGKSAGKGEKRGPETDLTEETPSILGEFK